MGLWKFRADAGLSHGNEEFRACDLTKILIGFKFDWNELRLKRSRAPRWRSGGLRRGDRCWGWSRGREDSQPGCRASGENHCQNREMFSGLSTAIHQFAKRQMTWFCGMERSGIRIHWVTVWIYRSANPVHAASAANLKFVVHGKEP